MPFPVALLFSLALMVASGWLSVATKVAALPAFTVIGTALWVYFDARRLGLGRYRTGLMNPEVATIGCFGVWIVAFPWYLSARRKILLGLLPLKDGVAPNG
jgi:hypothetical protein